MIGLITRYNTGIMKLLLHPLTQRQVDRLVVAPGGSIMLHGPQGVGKYATALEIARRINCEGCRDESCHSCKLIARGSHPDVVVLEPDEKGKISIEAVHQLQHHLQYQQFERGSQRVIIMRDIHTLTLPAQNALLKTLEEPPVGTTMIVTAESPAALLETIVSRCRPVYLAPVASSAIEGLLREQPAIDRELISEAVEMSNGLPGRALVLPSSEEAMSAQRMVQERVYSLLTERSLYDRLLIAQDITQKGSDVGQYVQMVTTIGRKLARKGDVTAQNLGAIDRLRARLVANVVPKTAFEALAVEVVC